MNDHLWTATSKETDVIKSAVKVYEPPYECCRITTLFALILKIWTHSISIISVNILCCLKHIRA